MEDTTRDHIQGLLDVISEPSTKNLVADLMRVSLTALQGLSESDQLIYDYHHAHSNQRNSDVDLDAMLVDLRTRGFKPVRNVISFMTGKELLDGNDSLGDDDDFDMENTDGAGFDFDLGGATGSVIPAGPGGGPESAVFGLDEGDIDAAFDFLAPEEESSDGEKLEEMKKELAMLGYAVREEFDTYEARIDNALEAGNHLLLLREFDSSRESLMEGLFAVVSTVFDIFLGECDRSVLLPGYRDVLDKSMLLRRGITDLTRAVTTANAQVQRTDGSDYELFAGFVFLIDALDRFRQSEAFSIMRAPDRLEFNNLLEQIVTTATGEARLASEGLSRYLESLAVVSQREVLIQNDQDTVKDIREALEAAQSLLMVSVPNAAAQAGEALTSAQRLYGRFPLLDRQLMAWEEAPPELEDLDQIKHFVDQLAELAL